MCIHKMWKSRFARWSFQSCLLYDGRKTSENFYLLFFTHFNHKKEYRKNTRIPIRRSRKYVGQQSEQSEGGSRSAHAPTTITI